LGAELTAIDAQVRGIFGAAVALSSDASILVVGSYGDDVLGSDTGSVYTYEWNSGTSSWDQLTKITSSDNTTKSSAYFGSSVALSSDASILVVGSRESNSSDLDNAGAVYTYEWNSTTSTWDPLLPVLTAIDGQYKAYFGTDVALSSDASILAVACPYWENISVSGRGAVYIYDWNGSGWNLRGYPQIDTSTYVFGQTVAMPDDASFLLVSCVIRDESTSIKGSVHKYSTNEKSVSLKEGLYIDEKQKYIETGYNLEVSSLITGTQIIQNSKISKVVYLSLNINVTPQNILYLESSVSYATYELTIYLLDPLNNVRSLMQKLYIATRGASEGTIVTDVDLTVENKVFSPSSGTYPTWTASVVDGNVMLQIGGGSLQSNSAIHAEISSFSNFYVTTYGMSDPVRY